MTRLKASIVAALGVAIAASMAVTVDMSMRYYRQPALPAPAPLMKGPLSRDETVGLVFTPLRHGGALPFSDPSAKSAVWAVLCDPSLSPYHPNAAIVLGYIADESDVALIEAEIRRRAPLSEFENGVACGHVNSLGIMARRNVRQSGETLLKMTKEKFWQEVQPRVFPLGGSAITDSDVMKKCAINAYVLCEPSDVDSVVRTMLSELPDGYRKMCLSRSFTTGSGLLTKRGIELERNERRRFENRRIEDEAKLRAELRDAWNHDDAHPQPTQMRNHPAYGDDTPPEMPYGLFGTWY